MAAPRDAELRQEVERTARSDTGVICIRGCKEGEKRSARYSFPPPLLQLPLLRRHFDNKDSPQDKATLRPPHPKGTSRRKERGRRAYAANKARKKGTIAVKDRMRTFISQATATFVLSHPRGAAEGGAPSTRLYLYSRPSARRRALGGLISSSHSIFTGGT